MVRVYAAVVAGLLSVFLALTIYSAYRGPDVVVPHGGVLHGPQDQLPVGDDAAEKLRARAELQRWRAESGPSPGEAAEPVVSTGRMPAAEDASAPRELVANWLQAEEKARPILREEGFLSGTVNLPQRKANVLVQPQGRDWRRLHNEEITFGGGYFILGLSFVLALFLAWRGRIRIAEGFSGRSIVRFKPIERANHWVTAVSFILMALTGLILLYGQYLLKPLMGANAYSFLATGSAYAHIAFAVPFVIGVVIMIGLWIGQNGFSRIDLQWLRRGGGFMDDTRHNPAARKFNAGQKLIFWSVVLGTVVLLVSGINLVLPFFWLDIAGMQWAQVVHAAGGLILIGIIIGHIYIGSVGMEGAFSAMWSGCVDRNWAREHHDLWVMEIEERADREREAGRA